MADPRFAKMLDVLAVTAPLVDFVDDEGAITLAKIDTGLDAGGAVQLPVGEQYAVILDFVSRAKAAGLKTLCFSLSSDSLAKTARNAGADYLAGDVIAGLVGEPGSEQPLAAAQ